LTANTATLAVRELYFLSRYWFELCSSLRSCVQTYNHCQ